jgi:hypothetical protein
MATTNEQQTIQNNEQNTINNKQRNPTPQAKSKKQGTTSQKQQSIHDK